jgi:hypothetical protein
VCVCILYAAGELCSAEGKINRAARTICVFFGEFHRIRRGFPVAVQSIGVGCTACTCHCNNHLHRIHGPADHMDAAKLEAKWPPDRKSAIEASEFGIYKEPSDGKRLSGTDRATGCLLVLSLIAAAAVVVSNSTIMYILLYSIIWYKYITRMIQRHYNFNF